MELWQAVVLAVIEGITEFLPISSTAHLVWGSSLLGVKQNEFTKTFEIAIQLGAIMAIVSLYFQKIWGKWVLLKKLATAFIPTGLIGFILYKFVKTSLLGNPWVSIFALAAGGVFIVVWEKRQSRVDKGKKIEDMGWKELVGIGVAQSLALVPGVSRAAATIFGGMSMGLSRKEAVEMSFLLAVPTMAAAVGWDLIKSSGEMGAKEFMLVIGGGAAAWITAMLVVRWLVEFVKTQNMKWFGWYRIGIAVVWAISVLRLLE